MSNQTLTFVLSLEEANIVLAGLGELPAKVSLPLIQKLQEIASTQIKAQQNESPAE